MAIFPYEEDLELPGLPRAEVEKLQCDLIYAQGMARGAAAERARIRRMALAEADRIYYRASPPTRDDTLQAATFRDFAALLEQ